MGLMLGIGLKLAAKRLLSSAFSRASQERPEEQLDSYRELDERFETKELPKEPPVRELTPKEQFKESIGDHGYGLDESSKSLYDRLTEDMKIVVDSNYEVANSINDKLDFTTDAIKVANENALNAANVAATYGKMNQEALIGLNQKSGSKITSLLSNIWSGIKKGIGGILGIIAGGVSAGIESAKESTSTTTGEEGVHAGLDATIEEGERFQQELDKQIEEAKKTIEEKSSDIDELKSPENIPNNYSVRLQDLYDKYTKTEEFNPEITGSEAFNSMISSMGDNPDLYKTMSDDEKSEVWDYMSRLSEAEGAISKSNQDIKAAKSAKKESEEAVQTAYYSRGLATAENNNLMDRVFKILKNEGNGNLIIGSPSYYQANRLGYSEITEDTPWEEIKEFGVKLLRQSEADKKELAKDIREGKLLSPELMEDFSLTKDGTLKSKFKNDETLFEQVVDTLERTLEKSTGEKNIDLYNYIGGDRDFERERSYLIQGISSGDITVSKDGEVIDPSKVTMLDKFNSSFFGGGYGSQLGEEYSFTNALTGEEISREGMSDWDFMSKLASVESNAQSELKDFLSQSGYSMEDIKSMSESQFESLTNQLDESNKSISYMLSKIWLNTLSNNTSLNVNVSGSTSVMSPGD